MNRSLQPAVDTLFVVVESIPWFMGIVLLATVSERGFLRQVRDRVLAEASGHPLAASLREAAESVEVGPSLVVVLIASLAAFFLMRFMRAGHLGGGFGGLLLLVASITVLNVLLRVVVTGDLRIWDNSGLVSFINDPSSYFPESLDLRRFLESPRIGRPHGTAITVSFVGLAVLWVRFLVAGRSPVSFERALRSFTLGFVAALVLLVTAAIAGAGGVAPFAVVHFVLGVLMLAVAHSARAELPVDDVHRAAPWAASVAVTMSVLVGIAGILALFALIDVGPLLDVVAFVLRPVGLLFEWLMILVLTPIVAVLSFVVGVLVGDRELREEANEFGRGGEQEPPPQGEGLQIPDALLDAGVVVLLTLALYAAFRLAVYLLKRRDEGDADGYAEERSREGETVGFGSLLRNLMPRGRRRGAGGAWMRSQAIYRLFGRAVLDAQERGLRRRPGETPLEFGEIGRRMLHADVMRPIAAAFDRARYGRHFPASSITDELEAELRAWELATPVSEDLRERIAGARQLSEAERIAANIELAKRAVRGDPRARRLRP